jgi:hypothetical protein
MSFQIVSCWLCRTCEVGGQDLETEPRCWNCGGEVIVTARPVVVTERHGPRS